VGTVLCSLLMEMFMLHLLKSLVFIGSVVFVSYADTTTCSPRLIGPTLEFVSKKFKMQEPVYFIFGFGHSDTTFKYKNQVKILVGMRFEVFDYCMDTVLVPIVYGNAVKRIEVLRGFSINLGYRQKSFWNVYDGGVASRPMYENDYSPSCYFSYSTIVPRFSLPIRSMIYYAHESNGQKDDLSRSWDRVGGNIAIGSLECNPGFVQLDMWVPIGLEENEEIARHYGIGELSFYYQPLFYRQHFLSDLGISFCWKIAADNLNNAELGFYCNPFQFMNQFFKRITPTIYAQLYIGSGENMQDYKDRHTSFRVGIATIF